MMSAFGFSTRSAQHRRAFGGNTPRLFALTQLPANALLDFDAAQNVSAAANKVSYWSASVGTGSFSQGATAAQPTLVPNGWATGVPVIRGDGVVGGTIMPGSEPLIENWWDFLVAARPSTDQNAVATYKTVLTTGRASDGSRADILLLRANNDASQSNIYTSTWGLASIQPGPSGAFGKGVRAVLWRRADKTGSSTITQMNVAGIPGISVAPSGSTTATITKIFGSDGATSERGAIDIARRLRIDIDRMPGKAEQLANGYLIEAYLHWAYGVQAALPSTHPFKTRAPLAADYSGNNRLWQGWGNSLGAGTAGQRDTVMAAAATGLTCRASSIGGTTSSEIRARFDNNYDIATAGTTTATTGLSASDVRKKINVIGELFQNDVAAGISEATGNANLAAMVGAIETAQGAMPGGAHLIIWLQWRGNGLGTDGGLAGIDARNVALLTANPSYASYTIDMAKELAKLAAPGSAYADADAYSRGVIPAALRAGSGDIIHLNSNGYLEAARIEKKFADLAGWTR